MHGKIMAAMTVIHATVTVNAAWAFEKVWRRLNVRKGAVDC